MKLAHSEGSELNINFFSIIHSNNLYKNDSLMSNKLIKYKISKQYWENSGKKDNN